MIGLIYLAGAAFYFSLLLGVMAFAYRRAKRKGLATRIAWKHAGLGFLIVYLPVFWDLVPIFIAHRLYCISRFQTEVHIPASIWLAKNNLAPNQIGIEHGRESTEAHREETENWRRSMINKYVVVEVRRATMPPDFLDIRLANYRALDVRNGDLLVEATDFMTGTNQPRLTFRPRIAACGDRPARLDFYEAIAQINLERERND